MEYTDEEKKILEVMFRQMREMLETFDLDADFSKNDLFSLAEKIGIDY